MINKITGKIKISVETSFNITASNPCRNLYYYDYTIHIENLSGHPMEIIGKHIVAFDGTLEKKGSYTNDIEGENPIIADYFFYSSSCFFRSTTGKITGEFILMDTITTLILKVDLPLISFIFPGALN